MNDRPTASASPSHPGEAPRAPGIPGDNPGGSLGAVAAAAEQAKAEASGLLDQAKDRAQGLVEDGKAAGADHATGFARAIHHAADDLEQSSPDIARHVRAAGDSVRGIAEAMRERSAGQLLEDVNDFARRQPALFFGAAAIAGFALVRFAKSSADSAGAGTSRSGGASAAQHRGTAADLATQPVSTGRATLGGAAAYHDGQAGTATMPAGSTPSQGLSTPVLRSGSVPNETSGSPL